MDITIYSNKGVIAETVKVGNDTILTQALEGENVIRLKTLANQKLVVGIGYYINFDAASYYINKPVKWTKIASNRIEYNLEFEADQYTMRRVQMNTIDRSNFVDGLNEFYLHGDADMFVDLILKNMNRVFAGWVKGNVKSTERQLLHFKNENGLSALKKVADKFELDWQVDQKTIHLDNIGNDTGHIFQYGRGNGLYEISRNTKANEELITRLYSYGGTKNLPSTYRSHARRLRFSKLFNILGNAGLCDDISLWNVSDPEKVDSTSGYHFLYGNGCIFVESGDNNKENAYTAVSVTAGKKYLLSGYVNHNAYYGTDITIKIYIGNGTTEVASISKTTTTDGYKRIGVSFTATSDCTNVYLSFLASENQNYCKFDGIQLTEITDQEYNNKTVSQLLEIYPFSAKDQLLNYVEANIDLYGVHEATKYFNNIFPTRTGSITNTTDKFTFTDGNIDFNINDYLVSGVAAKIHFQTGDLAGYRFEITSFDNNAKQFVIKEIQDSQEFALPNDTLMPQVGDEYKLVDIEMPDAYIQNAEERLKDASLEYLSKRCKSENIVGYDLTINWKYLRDNGINLNIGDLVTIKDAQFGINKKMKIIELSRPLSFPYHYSIKVADAPDKSKFVEMNTNQNRLMENQDISGVGDINSAISNGIKPI